MEMDVVLMTGPRLSSSLTKGHRVTLPSKSKKKALRNGFREKNRHSSILAVRKLL